MEDLVLYKKFYDDALRAGYSQKEAEKYAVDESKRVEEETERIREGRNSLYVQYYREAISLKYPRLQAHRYADIKSRKRREEIIKDQKGDWDYNPETSLARSKKGIIGERIKRSKGLENSL